MTLSATHKKKRLPFYILLIIGFLTVSLLLLFLSSLIPHSLIAENLERSADFIMAEGVYPTVYDHIPTAQLDNFTDALIVMSAGAMDEPADVILGTYYGSDDQATNVENFYRYVHGSDELVKGSYLRYWLGFRSVIRPLLCVMDYGQMRRFLGFLLLGLFALTTALVQKNLDIKAAIAYFCSILLMRPQIICSSLQFSCCFFICFAAMLLVPQLSRHMEYEKAFFMLLGMITMYLDFYTSPLLTLGMPLIYLCLIQRYNNKKFGVLNVLYDSLIWLISYGGMWICKLGLTQLFTGEKAFADGFGSFAVRTGIVQDSAIAEFYNPLLSLRRVFSSVYFDLTGLSLLLLSLLILLIFLIHRHKKGLYSFRGFTDPALLLIAFLPVLWYMVAAQPSCLHFWFQYRSLAVFFFALGAMAVSGFLPNKGGSAEDTCSSKEYASAAD